MCKGPGRARLEESQLYVAFLSEAVDFCFDLVNHVNRKAFQIIFVKVKFCSHN